MDISDLFRKMFIPTFLGMLMISSITIVDGAFVGQGVGSDALAAVNIVAPFFLLTTGVALMFGSGAAIVASVHLSRDKKKAADINITQAFVVATLIMTVLATCVMLNMDAVARLFGSSDRLMPYVWDYMLWVIPALPFSVVMCIGMFVIRMDGSPIYAMLCNAIPGIVNVVLDYLLIYPLPMGIAGAAIASSIAQIVGCIMVIFYMLRRSQRVNFYPLKLSAKSMRLTLRNIGYQVKLGASGLVGELAIACMMFVGNYMFIRYLGEDGVAAFSVACYCFPLVFMLGNAIAQSSQPIVSFNYGAGLHERVAKTYRISMAFALVSGILVTLGGILYGPLVIRLFIPDMASAAYIIACNGFPYFSIAFMFFTINMVCIGFFQSLERFKPATIFMLMRGLVFIIPLFILLPSLIGDKGLWLAVPTSELATFALIIAYNLASRRKF